MTKAWRIVLWAVLALIVGGAVLAGIGWLTGASPVRMADLLFGSVDGFYTAMQTAADTAAARLSGAWQAVIALF